MNMKEFVFRRIMSGSLAAFFGHKREIKKQKDSRRKKIVKLVKLSKSQKQQIDSFFKIHLGHKIGYQWHKIYTAISGSFDYMYFPEKLYSSDFQRLLNHPGYYVGLADKNILPLIIKGSFSNIQTPKTLFSCSNGLLLDDSFNIITKEEMLSTLIKKESFFVKPSVDSNSGAGCRLVIKPELNNEQLINIIKSLGDNFVIQETIITQKDLSLLNPSSVNTFRVITYILDGKVYATPVILRIGRNNNYCDNAHAGGLFVAVSNDGEIISDGKTEFGESLQCHPDSGIKFKGYKIQNVDKIILAAKKVAALIPRVGVVDWDFTIDSNGSPVLIEGNLYGGSVWLIQMAHGVGLFGNNTGRILEIIKNNKTLY